MTDATRCPDPDALLVLLYDDEGTPDERAALAEHVATCGSCAHVVGSLDTTRGMLGAWHAPRLPLGFALVREPRSSPARQVLWRGGLAAAAVLVLAAATSLARIEVTYDEAGFSFKTGVSPTAPVTKASVGSSAAASVAPPVESASPAITSAAMRSVPAAPPTSATPAPGVDIAAAPWRAELELLSTQLRSELARQGEQLRAARPPAATLAAAAVPAQTGPRRSMTDDELLRRVQDLLDQSEVRQQQNLALRVTELGRQFAVQRQADIVQVEQTLTRIEQQRTELLRRVSATQPRP